MDNNHELAVVPTEGKIVSDTILNFEDAAEVGLPAEHPNFIESNTEAITLEELATRCIVPT